MYNETNGKAIYPTPMIGMVGLIEDLSHITTQEFKQAGDLIYVIGETNADFNGTEIQKMQKGLVEGSLMDFDLSVEKENQELVLSAIKAGLVASAHDCAEGGLAVAIAEAAFNNQLGVEVTIAMPVENLFAETQSRFVLSIKPENQAAFEALAGNKAVNIGETTSTGELAITANGGAIKVAVSKAEELWEEAIPCLMK